MQSIEYNFKLFESAIVGKRLLVQVRNACRLFLIFALGAFWTTTLMAQSTIHLGSPAVYRAPVQLLASAGYRPVRTGFLIRSLRRRPTMLGFEQRLGSLQR